MFRDEIKKAVDAADAKSKFARDIRNLRLAHTDYSAGSGKPAREVPPASRALVDAALREIRSVMNLAHQHLGEPMVGYEHSVPAVTGVGHLLFHLQKGVDAGRM